MIYAELATWKDEDVQTLMTFCEAELTRRKCNAFINATMDKEVNKPEPDIFEDIPQLDKTAKKEEVAVPTPKTPDDIDKQIEDLMKRKRTNSYLGRS